MPVDEKDCAPRNQYVVIRGGQSVLGKLLTSKNCVSFAEGNSRNFAAIATWRALKRLHDQHSVSKNRLCLPILFHLLDSAVLGLHMSGRSVIGHVPY
jgi:hypothetical protein